MPDRDPRRLEHPAPRRDIRQPSGDLRARGNSGRRLLGLGALLLLLGGLALGVWRHYSLHLEVAAAAVQHRDFVPSVRVEAVRASPGTMSVTLPATTNAFVAADIYARASGYVTERTVDIGSRVKAGDLLAVITAPELDHQIAQAEASLAQAKASRRQTKANRELARVTWGRDSVLVQQGWVTQQKGDTDRLNYEAQKQAKQVNDAAVNSQGAQLLVLQQQKTYQQVVAPFDGVVTRRNVDVGSLVQADATSGTFMFSLAQSGVMRIRLYVPQDAAIGVKPGVDAVIRVPEMAGRLFTGKVTRIADALDAATRTLMTEIDVPNSDGELSPGIYCTVELKVPRRTPSLVVPAGAIVFDRDGLHVLVVEDGVVHSRKVTEIRDLGTEVEVSEGVKQSDQVVLTPPVDLEDGGKVQVRMASTAKSS
ncbi:MAG TPA: efflux RND transporter periplasmic adaptor subunit [Stellaceae bacterium]|nr:efflux RND transporter periplasmic adaptor subunit [Stellaceae bacterium]